MVNHYVVVAIIGRSNGKQKTSGLQYNTFPPSLDSVLHRPLIDCNTVFPPVGVVYITLFLNAVEMVYTNRKSTTTIILAGKFGEH